MVHIKKKKTLKNIIHPSKSRPSIPFSVNPFPVSQEEKNVSFLKKSNTVCMSLGQFMTHF